MIMNAKEKGEVMNKQVCNKFSTWDMMVYSLEVIVMAPQFNDSFCNSFFKIMKVVSRTIWMWMGKKWWRVFACIKFNNHKDLHEYRFFFFFFLVFVLVKDVLFFLLFVFILIQGYHEFLLIASMHFCFLHSIVILFGPLFIYK